MITKNRIKTVLILATVLAVLAAFGGPLQAALIIDEPFNYGGGANLTGDGGTGFDGAWATSQDSGVVFIISSLGLDFTGLTTTGLSTLRATSDGQAEANRAIHADSQTALFANDTTIWFSVLYKKAVSNGNAAFIIGTDTYDITVGGGLNTYVSGGEGFGFGSFGGTGISAMAYDNLTGLSTVGAGATSGTDVKMVVGKIDWKANDTDDVLTLYTVYNVTAQPVEKATITADLDQSAFDLVALQHNWDNATFDEIRIGTTLLDVGVDLDLLRPDPNAGVDKVNWSGNTLQLDASTSINNDEGTLTFAWVADPNNGVVFAPDNGTDPWRSNSVDPTITITRDPRATGNPRVVTLTLAVNNDGGTAIRTDTYDTMTIDLYDDACEAAVGVGATIAQGDLDTDCVTGLIDIAAISAAWQDDYSILAPVPIP